MRSSERKWKVKLKEWNFEKNISAKEMSFMVEKAEKRKRDEGKYTTFLRGGMEIPKEKFDQHKRRKVANHMEAGSSIVRTYSHGSLERLTDFRQKLLQILHTTLPNHTFWLIIVLFNTILVRPTMLGHPAPYLRRQPRLFPIPWCLLR